MNAARRILAASVVVAIAGAWGFAAEVFAPPQVSVPLGDQVCMSSRNSDDYLVTVGVTNEGRTPITLSQVNAEVLNDVEVLDTWVVSPEFAPGFMAVSYTPQAITDWNLVDVAGTVVAPGEQTQVVYRLMSASGEGFATDFTVEFTDQYGLHHDATSPFVAGFYAGDPSSDADCGP